MTPPALDAAVLESLRRLNQKGQPDVVREVLTVFLEDAPMRVAAIEQAISESDAQAAQRAAHTLKGAAANIGAAKLHQLCRELDEAAKIGVLDGVPALARQVEEEFARVRAEIEVILDAA